MGTTELRFKTNINCSGCVANVRPYLDNADGIDEWQVDTANKDKVLTVHTKGITGKEVEAIIKKAGYKIEPIY
ncbi:MAG: heavy-metal-associated domain-containing protein [Bacteroidetes bacterium]|nr:heavy-metal-associated domain-containing protein [Bacteroidota bacterium]MBS1932125.1 heavy-metal-associated domain-containing protein [Bacteroidota bacterium]